MDSKSIIKNYTNGEITIRWEPKICIHSGICARGLPSVFKPKDRPWIQMENANTEEIKEQVSQCPSGAITYTVNNEESEAKESTPSSTEIDVMKDGPLLIKNGFCLKDEEGNAQNFESTKAFCRCGASDNKPFCDGKHQKVGFKG